MKIKISFSKLVCLIILCVFIITQFVDAPWNREGAVIKSDVKGYYAYLPALFINNDLKFKNTNAYWENNEPKVWYNQSPEGVRYIKYSVGTAVLYAPFFGLAHLYADLSGYPQDGFSKPYLFGLVMSSLFFLIIAVVFMRKTLLLYFSETAVSLTLLVIFLGTNALNYYTFDACYSHGYSLAMITIFIYSTIRWFNTANYKYALMVGFSFGLIVIIRPVDILYCLFFPLFSVTSFRSLKERIQFFIHQKKQVLIIIVTAFICFLPQLIYFKFISGHWIFYTYTDETFFFSNPRWLEAMFSFRNGWLLYSPLMVLSLIGFVTLAQKFKVLFLPVVVVFIVYTFVISSWWCWWYVGFGNRAFINLYPLLSFPIAALMTVVFVKKWWAKFVFSCVLISGISFSIFQTLQYNKGLIHWGYMSKKAYYASFLKWEATPLFETYLEIPNNDKAIKGENTILKRKRKVVSKIHINFENTASIDTSLNEFIQSKVIFEGQKALFLPEWFEYTLNRKIEVKNANRIHITAWTYNPEELNLCISSNETQFNALSGQIVEHQNGWDKIEFYTSIPDNLKNKTLDFFVWKIHRNNAYLDDIRITLIEEELIE